MAYRKSPLFRGMKEEDIETCLKEAKAEIYSYEKEDMIFMQGEEPKKIMMIVEGSVSICNDSLGGKRSILAMFHTPGDLFGEVFLFLNHKEYENYALSTSKSKILQIPKAYLFDEKHIKSEFQNKMLSNLLSIFASKTYYLNRRLQILSCISLRQKIAKMILQFSGEGKKFTLKMNREEMADFLSVSRPSLSRELMNMQNDGLIRIEKKEIIIEDKEALLGIN